VAAGPPAERQPPFAPAINTIGEPGLQNCLLCLSGASLMRSGKAWKSRSGFPSCIKPPLGTWPLHTTICGGRAWTHKSGPAEQIFQRAFPGSFLFMISTWPKWMPQARIDVRSGLIIKPKLRFTAAWHRGPWRLGPNRGVVLRGRSCRPGGNFFAPLAGPSR